MKTIALKSIIIWVLLMLGETLNGAFRTFVLAPNLGDLSARQISVFTGAIFIFLITLASIAWMGAKSVRRLLAIGILWVIFTIAFEIMLGRLFFGFSWAEIAADYNLFAGKLILLGLVFMMFCPLLAAKIRNQKSK